MFKVTPGGIAWQAPDPPAPSRFFNHDCPGALIRRPISYCSHHLRAYLWVGPLRVRVRLRLRFLEITVGDYMRTRSKAFHFYLPQVEVRWITQADLARSRAFAEGEPYGANRE